MKRRVFSFLLALLTVLAVVPFSCLAADKNYGEIPIYIGHPDVDYMAEEVLKEIDLSGKTDREQIRSVYLWVIQNCSSIWSGKTYFNESTVKAQVDRYFYQQCDQALQNGEILIRPEYESAYADSKTALSSYDSNHYIANFAKEMMLKRAGDSVHYASVLAVLLGHLGFDCRVISGTDANHSWNYVLVDGQYQWLDAWADLTAASAPEYLLISDTAAWAATHTWNSGYSNWLTANSAAIQEDYEYGAAIFSEEPWSRCSNWAAEYMERAYQLQLIPETLHYTNLTANITRKEFAAVAVAMYEKLSGKQANIYMNSSPFSDTEDPAVLKAYCLGVVNGMGDGTFAPDSLLTREQAVTMLGRVYELVYIGNVDDGSGLSHPSVKKFADDSSIAAYAKNYIYYFVSAGVINGVGNNRFAPKQQMTREAALKTAVEAVK